MGAALAGGAAPARGEPDFEAMSVNEVLAYLERMSALAIERRERVKALETAHKLRQIAVEIMRVEREQRKCRAIWTAKFRKQTDGMSKDEFRRVMRELEVSGPTPVGAGCGEAREG